MLGVGSIDAFLHDTATVLVASYFHALLHHGIVDELIVMGLPGEEDLLDDVVTIDVLC